MNLQISDLFLCACLNKIVTYLIKPYLLDNAILLSNFKVLTNMKSVACLSRRTRAKNYQILMQTKPELVPLLLAYLAALYVGTATM